LSDLEVDGSLALELVFQRLLKQTALEFFLGGIRCLTSLLDARSVVLLDGSEPLVSLEVGFSKQLDGVSEFPESVLGVEYFIFSHCFGFFL